MPKLIRILLGMAVILSASPAGRIYSKAMDASSHVKVITSDYESIVLEMVAPEYQVEQVSLDTGTYDLVTIPGTDTTPTPGEPQLPVFNALIGVPPEAEIHLEILADDTARIHGKFSLAPAPTPLRIEQDFESGQFTYLKDPKAYSSDSLYPASPAGIEEQGWLRDQRIARISVFPIQYNPAQRTLLWHRQLRFRVTFTRGTAQENPSQQPQDAAIGINSAAGKNPFESILKGNLLNYEPAKAWRKYEVAGTSDQSSMLNQGSQAVKITVDHDGLYQIAHDNLQDTGMDLQGVDPSHFWLSNQGQDVAITVDGEEDGVFDPGDTITFYGEKFRGDRLAQIYDDEDQFWLNQFVYQPDYSSVAFDAQLNATMFEKYTEENVYWLTVKDIPGPRIEEVDGTPGEAEIPSFYWETIHVEESHIWWSYHFTDEDTWLWDLVETKNTTPVVTHTYTTTLSALATGPYSATIRGEVIAFTFNNYNAPDHHTQFFINETLLDDATWDGHVEYAFESQTSQSNLADGENEFLFVAHDTVAMAKDWLYFDWFEIEYARQFEATANQLQFSNNQGGSFRYQSHGFTNDDIQVYDITTAISPTRVISPVVTANGSGNYTVTFETSHDANARFFLAAVGDSAVIQNPMSITYYTPQDFASIAGADYVLITHHDFMTATQALADYRSSQGLATLVVDIDTLYNQFNYGIYHPIAVKNFLAYAFENWAAPPAYAVLIGSGHWDLRGFREDSANYPIYMPPNLAFVDPWQGEVDSANLLVNIVGDDLLPDLAIGRIPADSEQELINIIDKITTFETASWQDWQRNLVFVADNVPDSAGDFIASSEEIINNHLALGYNPIRIYENAYGCTSSGSSACKAVTNAITSTLNNTGTLIINYTGHGHITRWSGEEILNNSHLPTLNNETQPSIFIDMTCLTGYWIYPGLVNKSLSVELLTLENAGAVSTFSPTGLGVGLGHDELLKGFYDALFLSGVRDLGGATLAAKLRLFQAGYSRDLINTYTIFGDPALKIPILQSIFFPNIFK